MYLYVLREVDDESKVGQGSLVDGASGIVSDRVGEIQRVMIPPARGDLHEERR